jgi:hypothetical protein
VSKWHAVQPSSFQQNTSNCKEVLPGGLTTLNWSFVFLHYPSSIQPQHISDAVKYKQSELVQTARLRQAISCNSQDSFAGLVVRLALICAVLQATCSDYDLNNEDMQAWPCPNGTISNPANALFSPPSDGRCDAWMLLCLQTNWGAFYDQCCTCPRFNNMRNLQWVVTKGSC